MAFLKARQSGQLELWRVSPLLWWRKQGSVGHIPPAAAVEEAQPEELWMAE